MTYDQKYRLLRRANANGATLDGFPAHVGGARHDFATIGTINGPTIRAEFAWSTVARVMDNGGAFKSF